MFIAKFVVPENYQGDLRFSVLDEAAKVRFTLFTAPAGYLLTNSLAAALEEEREPVFWLRLGPEDVDPATFLISLADSVKRLDPGISQSMLNLLSTESGPLSGWEGLFSRFGRELASLPPGSALVIEHLQWLAGQQPVLDLFNRCLLPMLPDTLHLILTSQKPLPVGALSAPFSVWADLDLRLTHKAGRVLARDAQADLSEASLARASELFEGR